jgi:hypothetical protein
MTCTINNEVTEQAISTSLSISNISIGQVLIHWTLRSIASSINNLVKFRLSFTSVFFYVIK